MDGRGWRTFALRRLSLCGILVPPLDGTVNAVVAAYQPHYNPVREYVSALGATSSPVGDALSAFWIAFPFLFGPFAIAVYVGTRHGRHSWLTPLLLAIFSVCIGLCGVFRCSPDCASQDFSTDSHLIVSSLSSATLFPCPFFFWLTTRHDPRWTWLRRFSLFVQVLGIAALVALGLAFLHVLLVGGLCERLFWCVYYLWFVPLGIKLFRLGGTVDAWRRAGRPRSDKERAGRPRSDKCRSAGVPPAS
jgi:hypothetical protein